MADWTSLLAPGSRRGMGGQNDYIARMLMEQGMDSSPIQSPFQGLARLAQAYAGKSRMDAGTEERSQGNQALADLLAPKVDAVPAGAMQHAQLPEGGALDFQTPAIPEAADPRNAQIAQLLNGGIGQEQFANRALDQLGFGNPEEGFTLGEGQQRFDAKGNPIASVAPKPEKPTAPRVPTVRTFTEGDKTVDKQYNEESGKWEPLSSGPRYKPPVPAAAPGLKQEIQLRKEFDALKDVKDFHDVANSYDIISDIAARHATAQNDLSLIFSYMKMLDPGSVVREGEFANAQNTAGIPDQIRNAYNRARTGQRLNPQQRQEFTNTARGVYESRKRRYDQIVGQYQGYAKDSGLGDKVIVPRLAAGAPSAPKPSQNNDPLGIR